MAKSASKPLTEAEADALDAAQELIYEAVEAPTAKARASLAKRALALSPYCADAHGILAAAAKADSDQALAHWQAGVAAGKAALGSDYEEYVGEFWGYLETRPYMRALFGLAWALWLRGQRDEAIAHLQEMLVFNPNDNQGVRYILAAWLTETNQDVALSALLKAYKDDSSAEWAWTKALASFRGRGDTVTSRTVLRKACAENAFVAEYLLGQRPVPKARPMFLMPGQRDEATHYVQQYGGGWRTTEGALEWLAIQVASIVPTDRKSGNKHTDAAVPKKPARKTKPGAALKKMWMMTSKAPKP
jgi:tetratricopeptide (TPR) repeat protein